MPYSFNLLGSSSSRPPDNGQPVPSLDRAVASGTDFERPMPGSAAAANSPRAPATAPRPWGSANASAPASSASAQPAGVRREGGAGVSFRKIAQPATVGPELEAPLVTQASGSTTRSFRPINSAPAGPVDPYADQGMLLPSHHMRLTVPTATMKIPEREPDTAERHRHVSRQPPSPAGAGGSGKRPASEGAQGEGLSASARKKKRRKQKAAEAAAAAQATSSSAGGPTPMDEDDSDEIVEVDSSIPPLRNGLALKIEEIMAQLDAASKNLPIPSFGPLTPTNSSAQVAASGSGNLSTPSGTLSAPISITTTASAASNASARAAGPSRPATSTRVRSPRPALLATKIIELEVSDDGDAPPSDAESVLEMDPITISSSEEGDYDASSEDESAARAAKRKRQAQREKAPVAAAAAAAKRKISLAGTVYYLGKVGVSRAGSQLGFGQAKIITDEQGRYELRLRLKKHKADAGADDIVSSKAQLRDALLSDDERTISWRLHGQAHAAHFVETSSWLQFQKAFIQTLKTARTPSPRPATSRMSVGPSPKRMSASKPAAASSASMFMPPSKAAGTSAAHTSPAKANFKKRDAPAAPAQLEPRKIKPPARFETDRPMLTDDGTDLELLPKPKPKMKVRTAKAPLAPAQPKKASDRSRIEEIVDDAVSKEPSALGKHAKVLVPSTEFTIEVLQCNLGTGKIPLSATGTLPKNVCLVITAEMASNSTYTENVSRMKETLYYVDVSWDTAGKKTMTFNPPLSFHMPAAMFRTLPTEWPFMRDRGYRKGHYVRLKIDFLSFVDRDKRPSEWILNEFGDYNQDEALVDFQCPYAEVPLIRPHRSGEMDRQVSTSNRAQLSIGGMELNPAHSHSFKYQAFWDAAAAANAPEVSALRKERPAPAQPARAAAAAAAVQPAAVGAEAKRKGKGRLVVEEDDEEMTAAADESCAEALGGLQIAATNAAGAEVSDESPLDTPLKRDILPFEEDEHDNENDRAKQAFTMVFEPSAPTFRPSADRAVPKGSQKIQPGTLAHDLASLDRSAVDNEIIEREEAIFDIEGIHDGQKFVMALWNRWCSTFGRIHQHNSDPHILGFINRYFTVMHQRNVRRYLVIHLQVLSAFDLCQNDTFAQALAQYTRMTAQVLKQNGALQAAA